MSLLLGRNHCSSSCTASEHAARCRRGRTSTSNFTVRDPAVAHIPLLGLQQTSGLLPLLHTLLEAGASVLVMSRQQTFASP